MNHDLYLRMPGDKKEIKLTEEEVTKLGWILKWAAEGDDAEAQFAKKLMAQLPDDLLWK